MIFSMQEKMAWREKRIGQRRQANAELPLAEGIEAAKERALRVLDRAAQSRADLEKKLQQSGYTTEMIRAALDRLTEVGLVNDQEYALMLIRSRTQERGLVGRALEQELLKKGINYRQYPAVVEYLTQIADQQTDNAQHWASKKARQLPTGLERKKAVARIASFLARKGYSPTESWTQANRAWEEIQEY